MKQILHICAGWQPWNGAANIARFVAKEHEEAGNKVTLATWASISLMRSADEVWIHCGWLPCLWWAALWGRNVHWMPEACYDPVRLKYHGWKKSLVGPIERFCLRRCKTLVATCEAEKDWIQSYLGKRCPPVEVTDIKRFFRLPQNDKTGQTHFIISRPLHLLYLGRRHPLKGLSYLESALATYYNMWSEPTTASHPGEPPSTTYYNKCSVEFRAVSNAFGEELEKIWDWCDVLVLPTLSDNFGLVIAEALERGKRVITTDGAPAWEEGLSRVERVDCVEGELWSGYGGRLIYLKGYRDGTPAERVGLLKHALSSLVSGLTSK